MDRTVAISIGVLLLVTLSSVALIAYPLSETEHRSAADGFVVGESDAYRIVANISVDGETALGVNGAVTETGERYVRIREENLTTERYQSGPGEAVYTRYVLDDESAERRVQTLEDDPGRTVIRHEESNGTATVLVAEEEGDAPDPTGAASVVAAILRVAAYERTYAGENPLLHVLEPRSDWYDGVRSYRITESTGEVRIDPDSNVLHAADVRWELTLGTQTYLHYLVSREDSVTQEIAYDYDPEDVDVEPPGWVDAAVERAADHPDDE